MSEEALWLAALIEVEPEEFSQALGEDHVNRKFTPNEVVAEAAQQKSGDAFIIDMNRRQPFGLHELVEALIVLGVRKVDEDLKADLKEQQENGEVTSDNADIFGRAFRTTLEERVSVKVDDDGTYDAYLPETDYHFFHDHYPVRMAELYDHVGYEFRSL